MTAPVPYLEGSRTTITAAHAIPIPVRGDRGAITEYLGSVQDISHLQTTTGQLRASEERLAAALSAADDIISQLQTAIALESRFPLEVQLTPRDRLASPDEKATRSARLRPQRCVSCPR